MWVRGSHLAPPAPHAFRHTLIWFTADSPFLEPSLPGLAGLRGCSQASESPPHPVRGTRGGQAASGTPRLFREMLSRRERCPQASRVPSPSQEQWTPDGSPPRNCHSCHSLAYTQMQQLRSEQAPQGSTRNSGTSASRKHPEVPPGPTAASAWPWDAPPTEGSGATGLLGLRPVWGFAHRLPQFPQLFLPEPGMREVGSSPPHLEPTRRGQRAKGKGKRAKGKGRDGPPTSKR